MVVLDADEYAQAVGSTPLGDSPKGPVRPRLTGPFPWVHPASAGGAGVRGAGLSLRDGPAHIFSFQPMRTSQALTGRAVKKPRIIESCIIIQ